MLKILRAVCRKISRTRERENVKALESNIRNVFLFARLKYFQIVVGKLTRKYDTERVPLKYSLSFFYNSILIIDLSNAHRQQLFFNGVY